MASETRNKKRSRKIVKKEVFTFSLPRVFGKHTWDFNDDIQLLLHVSHIRSSSPLVCLFFNQHIHSFSKSRFGV